jgi:hypothetical protein
VEVATRPGNLGLDGSAALSAHFAVGELHPNVVRRCIGIEDANRCERSAAGSPRRHPFGQPVAPEVVTAP